MEELFDFAEGLCAPFDDGAGAVEEAGGFGEDSLEGDDGAIGIVR